MMAPRTKTDTATGEITELEPTEAVHADDPVLSKWEFWDRTPEPGEALELLKGHGEVYGIKYADYADFVQGIPQSQTVSKKGEPEVKRTVTRLYMSVAGRVQMLTAAAVMNDWRVEFEPEPNTKTGVPGVLDADGSVTYRVYLRIYQQMRDGSERSLGSRTGVSWRTGTNSWEKAETAANGRAIAAWGIGVLPGSGIASLDEIQSGSDDEVPVRQVRRNRRGDAQEPTEEDLMNRREKIAYLSGQIQNVLGHNDAQHAEWLAVGIKGMQIKDGMVDGQMNFDAFRPGQLQVWEQTLARKLRELIAAGDMNQTGGQS